MISSDGVFFHMHNWAVDNPPPAIPYFDHHFQMDQPLPDIDMDGIDFQAPPPGFAAQWNPQGNARWINEPKPMEADVIEDDGPQEDDM